MSTVISIEEHQATGAEPRWSLVSLLGFRFAFVFFGFLCLSTQVFGGLISIPNVDMPDPATLPPLKQIVEWTAAHIFHVAKPLVETGSGSGDKTFDWVLSFCLLVIAAVATGIWTLLDRRRGNHNTLHKWFRVFLRFSLGSQMLVYGLDKVFPMQMSFPGLHQLLEPYGQLSPMGVLWSSVGASPGYEILCGSAEVIAGLLLLTPGLTMLGALICAGVTMQIFILNMTYDVPVKLFSFQLLLMSLFLLAPEFSRLAKFLVLNRAVEASTHPRLFRTPRANRIAIAVQIIFAAWILGSTLYGSWRDWFRYGGGAPKSPLYGIWNVDQLSIDGHTRSPLLNDYGRWRRVIFDYPSWMAYERMDDSFDGYNVSVNVKDQTIELTKNGDKNWKGQMHYQRPAAGQMTLDGSLGGHPMQMQLKLVDRNSFRLVSRGFHWVQEYPYNR
ncbi:MAG TPA: hypothetical protein VHZ52_08890 [Acidobacteriaceae bacterium]|jgi:uncharacterized membrane protein YphA (DoxX/SURF4 family)|nr:hypothetical protein [Acidobacteriaceae bacterium]